MARATVRMPQRVRPMRLSEKSIPSPTSGWNTRDALDAMDPADATRLDNFFPDVGKVVARKGFTSFATLTGMVDTLTEYSAGAIRRLVGAAGGNVYDIGQGTTVGTGFSSNRWQSINFNAKLFLVNGTDAGQTYDGTTLAATGFTGPSSPLIGIHPFGGRVWGWEASSQKPYYGGLGSITGAMTAFPLNTVSKSGGNLIAMGTLSRDSATAGPLVYCCFVMSPGEIIIYQGTDPATWTLQGIYKVGAPLGPRGVIPVGGDLAIITLDDYVKLSDVMTQGLIVYNRSKVSGAVQAATLANAGAFGWDGVLYPRGNRMLFNVPNLDGSYDQHVLNTITGAWCRFRGMNAKSWSLWNDALYFGAGDGKVYLADSGAADNGAAIVVDGQPAWTDLGTPARKRIAMARPMVQIVGAVSYSFAVGYDFNDPGVTTSTTVTSGGSPWDTSPWDTSPWSPESLTDQQWRVEGDSGRVVTARLQASLKTSMSWLQNGYRFESGSSL